MASRHLALFFMALILLNGSSAEKSEKSDEWCLTDIALVVGGGVAAVVATPIALGAAGFGATGIAAGSLAATAMSTAAVANGGGVVAGGLIATAQSIGAAGLGLAGKAAVGAVGAATGKAVSSNVGACDMESDCPQN